MIDADALNERIDKCVGIDGLGLEPVMAIRDIKAMVSVMPTIESIPVEWLKKQRQEAIQRKDWYTRNVLDWLFDEWQR